MKISEIYRKGKISVRSYNVCIYNNLNSVKDLKEYLSKRKSFTNLRNCGRKSNEELIEICDKYQGEYLDKAENEKKENPLKKIILELTRLQREVINNFILVNINSLTNRSKNAISLNLNRNFKIKNLAERVFFSNIDVEDWVNVGEKSIEEIDEFFTTIKKFIIEVNQSNEDKYLISLKNNFLIQHTFSISEIPSEILESESIFSLTNFLLNQYVIFTEKPTLVIKKALKIYQNQEIISLEYIAKEVNLTRERVRQIKVKTIKELHLKFLFIQNFNEDLFQNYNIDINSNYLDINTDVVENINKKNKINLSKEFITYILYSFLNNNFFLVGEIEDVLDLTSSNSTKKYNWKNFYLIKKELVIEIDFNVLVNDIDTRINDRIEESYSFSFKSYLFKFLTNNNIDILNLIFPIAEKIINDEFELYLDLDENLIFKRNTIKQAYEYSYEALEQLGKPSKVEEIFEKVLEIHPNYNTEEAQIRISMKRKNGFVPIGRKSVFGLKKWEKELENFKGGTIRDIVEEYLMQFSVPKYISDITEHVLRYRPKSNQYSILQNLKLDESGLYIFFKDSHIGLATKKYDSDFKKISELKVPDKRTWEESLEVLKDFIVKQKRLPFSSGCSESEKKLYRWFNIQKVKCYDGKIDKNKEVLIIEIDKKYPQINGKRRSNSDKKYTELITFIKINFRFPSANKNGEENLYQFLYKQRKLFDKNKLEAKEKVKFIETIKILENIKYENKRNESTTAPKIERNM
ncbi:hypothetical protein [Tenacibaculum piscium]|uniref:hypothetical protein n=1 Tax=Tenacibaculum piscium TaxID=1458515 RepID=UPI001EFA9673|nr:hypothetical protein [Tenacibaculum piscium]MCG8183254.1 hypothetical protein [Tenacibaculum piscium]MCG8204562.1 hypothetical protein [Tenacibaculum piscium]